jgi:hypothetical protein
MAGTGPLVGTPGAMGSRGLGSSPGNAALAGALARRSGEESSTSSRFDRPPAVRHSVEELLTALRKVNPVCSQPSLFRFAKDGLFLIAPAFWNMVLGKLLFLLPYFYFVITGIFILFF